MYNHLLSLHSFSRWLALLSLLYAIYRAFKGYRSNAAFTKTDNSVRHWTATIAHIQLIIGFTLYLKSPVIQYFFSNAKQAIGQLEVAFFGLIHFLFMLTAIVVITIGSALAKRKSSDHEKFKTMFTWFVIALLIIFMAIPWPFSPLASRPYIRNF